MYWLLSNCWAVPINPDTFDNHICDGFLQIITGQKKKRNIMQISHKRCFLLGKAGITLLVKMVWHWPMQEPLICVLVNLKLSRRFRSLNARPIVFRRIYPFFPVTIPQLFSAKSFLFSSFTRSNICEIFLPALFLNNIFVTDCKRSQPFTQLAWLGRKYKFDKELEVDTGDG